MLCVRALALFFCGVAVSASLPAEVISFGFTGTVTSISNVFGYLPSTIQVGLPVTGNFSYDTSAIPSPSNSLPGFQSLYVYASPPSGMSIQVGGLRFANAFEGPLVFQALVRDSSTVGDLLELDGFGSANTWPPGIPLSPGGFDIPRVTLSFVDNTSPFSLINGTQLPRSIDLRQADSARGFISSFNEPNPDPFYQINFRIDSVTPIPEPGTMALIAVAGVMGLARRTALSALRVLS